MTITTKIGDKQTSRFFSGEEAPKDDLRFETYGTLDEFVAALGLARSFLPSSPLAQEIRDLQVDLFRVGGELATTTPEKLKWVEATAEKHVQTIEARMKHWEEKIKLPKSFLIPGATQASAALDLARTICRRLERLNVRMFREGSYANKQGLIYLNRLSDYCFWLARAAELEAGVKFDAKD